MPLKVYWVLIFTPSLFQMWLFSPKSKNASFLGFEGLKLGGDGGGRGALRPWLDWSFTHPPLTPHRTKLPPKGTTSNHLYLLDLCYQGLPTHCLHPGRLLWKTGNCFSLHKLQRAVCHFLKYEPCLLRRITNLPLL